MRQRLRTLKLAAPILAFLPSAGHAKIQLWRSLAAASLQRPTVADQSPSFLAALKGTQAYADAQMRLVQAGSGVFQRGVSYRALLQRWCEAPPERLLIFHHYDQRGLLPVSWREALLAVKAAGWQVVVSSSDLQASEIEAFELAGCQVALRTNVGWCLGAYRDLALLLLRRPELTSSLCSLVLCNDSNVLLQKPAALLHQLDVWCADTETNPEPVLSGLTDSAERGRYHLQSFCLHVNRALLQHPAWLRYWLGLSLQGSKDDLINHGEIGLSQALLGAGVQLRPAYPLVQGLMEDPAMVEELQRYSIWQPRHANQSLFAWQSLLARGFPLVKKHVLFELIENQGLPMAMAELSRWIPEERRALLVADLQQLFVSRYSGAVPEMG